MGWLGGAFNLLGSVVSGIFGLRKEQSGMIQNGLKVLNDVNSSAAQREAAVAQIISAEATSGYWLAAVWRPLAMVIFLGFLISFWFGYTPPNMMGPMPPMIAELFGLIKLGLGGYIGARTVEKVMQQVNLGRILRRFIERNI